VRTSAKSGQRPARAPLARSRSARPTRRPTQRRP
jgi:hypothetical protein